MGGMGASAAAAGAPARAAWKKLCRCSARPGRGGNGTSCGCEGTPARAQQPRGKGGLETNSRGWLISRAALQGHAGWEQLGLAAGAHTHISTHVPATLSTQGALQESAAPCAAPHATPDSWVLALSMLLLLLLLGPAPFPSWPRARRMHTPCSTVLQSSHRGCVHAHTLAHTHTRTRACQLVCCSTPLTCNAARGERVQARGGEDLGGQEGAVLEARRALLRVHATWKWKE